MASSISQNRRMADAYKRVREQKQQRSQADSDIEDMINKYALKH